MELLRKKKSKFYWYDFTVRGRRYRGSTKESNRNRAGSIAAIKLAHKDVKTAMQYQHPELEIVRAALNQTGSATEPGA